VTGGSWLPGSPSTIGWTFKARRNPERKTIFREKGSFPFQEGGGTVEKDDEGEGRGVGVEDVSSDEFIKAVFNLLMRAEGDIPVSFVGFGEKGLKGAEKLASLIRGKGGEAEVVKAYGAEDEVTVKWKLKTRGKQGGVR